MGKLYIRLHLIILTILYLLPTGAILQEDVASLMGAAVEALMPDVVAATNPTVNKAAAVEAQTNAAEQGVKVTIRMA